MLSDFFMTGRKPRAPNSMALKKDEMSQDFYDDLIARIRTHCQQVAQDALDPKRHRSWSVGNDRYTRCYVPEHKSFIALSKKYARLVPRFAFPTATETQLLETEQQLGFLLPPLLRLLDTRIMNGGFGPGYGIIGVLGGFSFTGDGGKNIVQSYRFFCQECKLINLENYEIMTWEQFEQSAYKVPEMDTVQSRAALSKRANMEWNQTTLYALPYEVWPERLVPLCDWGCAISTCLDTQTERLFQLRAISHGYILRYVASSLEEWLERWLAGESLQFL